MGKSLKIPDFRSETVQKQSEDQIKSAISKGKNKMPGYEGKLTKDQIDKLVAYIRGLAKH